MQYNFISIKYVAYTEGLLHFTDFQQQGQFIIVIHAI